MIDRRGNVVFEDPPIARRLFNNTRSAWLWLPIRLYIGYIWLTSGIGKVGNPAWMETGEALAAFWTRMVQVPDEGTPPIAFDWYRDFLVFLLDGGYYVWFARLIVIGELAVGIALLLGAFVGIAAFFAAFMNWNFMMAGVAGVNPVLFTLGILLILAWKTAGYIGLDRWLLPLLGTPWRPGIAFSAAADRTEGPPAEEESADDDQRAA